MSLKSLLLIFLISSPMALAQSSTSKVKLKNGRQYVRSLSIALGIDMYDLRPEFEKVKLNLPKTGDIKEFHSAKDSMAKLAGFSCDIFDWIKGPDTSITELYQMMLLRNPTDKEIKNSIKFNDEISIFCKLFSLSPTPRIYNCSKVIQI